MFIHKKFEELSVQELYAILKARQDVFVVEQKCAYPDIDGIDPEASHLFTMNEEGKVTSCLRLFWKKDEPHTAQIGRVLTTERGTGLGGKILHEGVRICVEEMKADEIYLEAQTYATGYYAKEGFEIVSEPFEEDGILHVQMRKKINRKIR
jgi:ElaA protein